MRSPSASPFVPAKWPQRHNKSKTRNGSKDASSFSISACGREVRSTPEELKKTRPQNYNVLIIIGMGTLCLFYGICIRLRRKCTVSTDEANFRPLHQITQVFQINCSFSHNNTHGHCLLSDVCGCLTSPAWALLSLSALQTQALFRTDLQKYHYWWTFI